MAKLIDKTVEFLDDLALKLFPHPASPKGEPVCNVSPETEAWNRAALEYSWKPGNGIVPIRREFSAEEIKKMQEETYKWNAMALDYANSH